MSTQAQGVNISEEARRWVIATHDPSFDGWEQLFEWLERDPAPLAAYEAALDADEWAAQLLADAPRPAADVIPLRARRRWFLGAGIAASLLAAVGGWIVF